MRKRLVLGTVLVAALAAAGLGTYFVSDGRAREGKGGKGPPADAQALVREASELIAIVTTIVKNKRKNVAAKTAAEKAAKAARRGRLLNS